MTLASAEKEMSGVLTFFKRKLVVSELERRTQRW